MWFDGGATGMYKTQTRLYQPGLGRFTQVDPAKAGNNWYAYCGGDPVNRADPTGLYWEISVGMGSNEADIASGGTGRMLKPNARWVPWIDGISQPGGGVPSEVMDAALAQLDQTEGRGVVRVYTGEEEAAYQQQRAALAQGGRSRWVFRHDQVGNAGVVAANESVATVAGIGDDVLTALVYYGTAGNVLHDTDMDDSVRGVAADYHDELNANIPGAADDVRLISGVTTSALVPIPGANAATRGLGTVVARAVDYAADAAAQARNAQAAAQVQGQLARGLDQLALTAPARSTGNTTGLIVAMQQRINPNMVRFSQDSIGATFKNGGSIDDLASGLRNGATDPAVIPQIRLFERDGVLYTLDNRRLWAFQQAGVEVPYRMATADEVAAEAFKFTTSNQGASVRVRGR